MPYAVIAEHRSENIVPFGVAMTDYWTARDAFQFAIAKLGEVDLQHETQYLEWTIRRYVHAKYAELTPETATMQTIGEDLGNLMTVDQFEEQVEDGLLIDYDGWGSYATATHVSRLTIRPSHVMDGFVYPNWTHVLWYNR